MDFAEDYFENGIEKGISGYQNYHYIKERSDAEARAVSEVLRGSILDYGCAKGYLVQSLRDMKRNAWGEDISTYALSKANIIVQPFVSLPTHKKYDSLFSKDVLEHVPYPELSNKIYSLAHRCKDAFIIVPLAKDGKYIIPDYEKDITHVIRFTKDDWSSMFKNNGFKIKHFDYSHEGIKDNWTNQYPEGNGFYYLRGKL